MNKQQQNETKRDNNKKLEIKMGNEITFIFEVFYFLVLFFEYYWIMDLFVFYEMKIIWDTGIESVSNNQTQ